MLAKVDSVERALEREDLGRACNQLDVVISEVEAVRGVQISHEVADHLTELARGVAVTQACDP